MSLQATFSKAVGTGLTKLISQLGSSVANEIEFRLGEYDENHFIPGQNLLQFKNIIEHLQRKKYKLQEESSLDINIVENVPALDVKKLRTTISSLINVRKFCIGEKISSVDKNSVSYMKKVKLETPYDLPEYGLRAQFSKEDKISDGNLISQIDALLSNTSVKKLYRYKQRYSFTSYEHPVRFDLTLVKSATGTTFKNSNTLSQKENYEVELEYLGSTINTQSDPVPIVMSIIGDLYNLLKWSQDSFAVITRSEKKAIFNEYINLVFPNELTNVSSIVDMRNFFVSMDVLPLDMDKVMIDAEGNYYIKEGYCTTDKADGDHSLLLISNHANYKGSMYLINNRMEIKHTGLQMQNVLLYGSLFDGELVVLKDSNTYSYLIFDSLFWGGQDMRDLPLYTVDSKMSDIENIENRYQAVIKFIEQSAQTQLSTGVDLEINYKRYLFKTPKSERSIFQLNEIVYVPAKYNYHLDGLILTPYNDKYPKASLIKIVRWERLLKWKDLPQLSIDFLVETVKKGGTEVIKSDYDTQSGKEWKYKEAVLKLMKTVKTKTGFQKQFIDFIPTKFKVPDLHRIKLRLDEDGEMRANDQNIIYSGSTIEFIYDAQQSAGYQWIPLRFRADKTAAHIANAFRTGDSTWALIKNPVTVSIITGQKKVDIGTAGLQYYTQNSEALGKLVAPLRAYHNNIKLLLITEVANAVRNNLGVSQLSLLDVASGRAGDLHKWSRAGISYVLGIDADEKNLTNEEDGALARYNELKIKGSKYPEKVEFIWGDSSKHLNTGAAGQDSVNREYLRTIMTSRGPASFDIVSCQFALHYFLANEKALEDFLYNVSLNLKLGGYFIGTTLDGRQVYNALSTTDPLVGTKKNIRIWQINKAYKSTEDFAAVGQKINVYNVNIGQEIAEYLVNFDNFTKRAKQFGLELVKAGELPNLIGLQSFKDIYDKIISLYPQHSNLINGMGEDEKLYSFMNNYFIYKKVASPGKAAVTTGVVEESLTPLEKITVPILLKKPIIKKPVQNNK